MKSSMLCYNVKMILIICVYKCQKALMRDMSYISHLWGFILVQGLTIVSVLSLLYNISFYTGPHWDRRFLLKCNTGRYAHYHCRTAVKTYTVLCVYNTVNFLTNIYKRHLIAHPGMSFVDPVSVWCSAPVPVIIYVISYSIGARYNGTQLYKDQ